MRAEALRRWGRLGWLVFDEVASHVLRTGLLIVGVAVSVFTFLGAVALGQSNVDGLRDTVRRTQGAENTYLVQFPAASGPTWDADYVPEVRRVLRGSGASAVAMIQRFDLAHTSCGSTTTDRIVVVDGDVGDVLSPGFSPTAARRNADDRRVAVGDCPLAALPIEADVGSPTSARVAVGDGELMVDRSVASTSITGPSSATAALIRFPSGAGVDIDAIRRRLGSLVGNLAAFDDRPGASFTLDRTDTAARFAAAERSARIVMFAFAGATMALSCMAITLTYLAASQQRQSSLGLSRAAGALRSELMVAVVGEILAVIAVGTSVAVVAAVLAGPSIGRLADGDVQLLSSGALGAMAGAVLLTSLLAAVGPGVRVLRLGVADVLASTS